MIARAALRKLTPASLAIIMTASLLVAFVLGPARAEGDVPPDAPFDAPRVVSVGGSVTEIIHELGMAHLLVARDTTSSWPPDVTALPDVGYMRALSPEGILSVRPDLIIAEAGSGPPEAIDVLVSAEVAFVEVPESFDAAGVRAKILAVADALDVAEAGLALAERVEAELAAATASLGGAAPRVLFILSMQNGRVMASGTGTAAAGIIDLAGGRNAVDAFEGYRQLTDEAVLAAAPDVILMMDREGDHAAADADLFAHPALGLTPAAEEARVVRIDGLLLLGFGPRTPVAVTRLADALGTLEP